MTVGENLKKIRTGKGLTQKQLGEKCGIDESNIRKYENGKQNPKIETIQKIAAALDVPISHILPWEKYKQTEEYKQIERYTYSAYAVVKILEELYKRAEIIDVSAYNNGEFQYSSDYISLGIEPNKIAISNEHFDIICEQIRQILKSSIELVSENENDMLTKWLRENDIDELQTSEAEHVIIRLKDNQQKQKYTKYEKTSEE